MKSGSTRADRPAGNVEVMCQRGKMISPITASVPERALAGHEQEDRQG